jgi:hypothetical protein
MTAYAQGRIYPNSIPEFRHLQKSDGTIEMQVRYINTGMGYTGKWQDVPVIKQAKENFNVCN